MRLSRQISSASDETFPTLPTVSARWVFLPPNAIPLGLSEKRNMKKVKELIQDIKWFAVALYALAFIREGGEA